MQEQQEKQQQEKQQQEKQQQEKQPQRSDQKETKNYEKVVAVMKNVATFVYNSVWINIIIYFIFCNIVHHYASKMYIHFCAYSTPLFQMDSVLMSPIVIISPHCMGLRWLILESSNTVYFQLLTCCSWFISRISK